jgi:lipid-binding SYLF domain-containing protein
MKTHFIIIGFLVPAIAALSGCQTTATQPSATSAAAQIDRDVDVALTTLYDTVPKARELEEQAEGILVFPRVVKAGFIGGAQYGKGALRQGGRTVGYYNTLAASYGLQAGLQSFGYALFFMNDAALSYLDRSGGWEVGVGPSIVVLDHGKARALTTTTLKDDVYAFIFSQRGLMAGLGLQGSKITKINP